MKTRTNRNHWGSFVVTAAGFLVGLMLAPTVAFAYSPTWTRLEAGNYAATGLYERYVLGGKKWIANNVWDPAGTSAGKEGVDCSGYVAKSWALERWSDPQENYPTSSHGTWHFYHQTTNWVHRDILSPYVMAGYVYRNKDDTAGHMGLFRIQDSSGGWRTWEARGSSYGVRVVLRSLTYLNSLGAKGVDRKNWGTDYCLGCIPNYPVTQ